jgi:FkbM family methyltransferase
MVSEVAAWVLGMLFDGVTVRVSPLALAIGGSWQVRDQYGRPWTYDAELVQFFAGKVRPGMRIADVGASTGSFSLLPLIVDCWVDAFEPNPLAAAALRANLALNGIEDRVLIREVALTNHNGHARLMVPHNPGAAGIACLGQPHYQGLQWHPTEVVASPLDTFGLDLDLLKIDVEGAELWVLEGAAQTIDRCRPGILVEYNDHHTRQCGYRREAIVDWLKGHGYVSFLPVGKNDLWVH